jgi:glycosyl-4,4'-diaponeurosporenoate acyltransferase
VIADVRVVHLADGWTIALDVVAWAIVHATAGYIAHRLPLRWLGRDVGPLRLTAAERRIGVYRRLRIARWKDRLPEAGALFAGGMSKRHLPARDAVGLARFVAETRRAEWAHWPALAAVPVFALFNPPVAAAAMVAYGVAANVPCILVQRYNRARLVRALARSRRARETIGSSIP